MIRFKINNEEQLFKSFLDLNEMIREGDYGKSVMIGSYNDFVLVKLGVIIDGKGEKALAEDFEEYLRKKDFRYERINQFGVLFHSERTF